MSVNTASRTVFTSSHGQPFLTHQMRLSHSSSWYASFDKTVSAYLSQAILKSNEANLKSLHRTIIAHNQKFTSSPAAQLFSAFYLQKNATVRRTNAIEINRPISHYDMDVSSEVEYHREYDSRFCRKSTEWLFDHIVDKDPMEVLPSDTPNLIREGFLETLSLYCRIEIIQNFSEIQPLLTSYLQEDNNSRPLILLIDNLIDLKLRKSQQLNEFKAFKIKLGSIFKSLWSGIKHAQIQKVSSVFLHCYEGMHLINFFGDKQSNMIGHIIVRSGYTPTMLQLVQMHQNLKISPCFSSQEINLATPIQEKSYQNCESFFSEAVVKEYQKLGKEFNEAIANKKSPAIQALLANANYKMLWTLRKPLNHLLLGMSLHEIPVINSSLNRIEALIALSLHYCQNHARYCLLHELIAEEILLLLNLVKPYDKEGPNSFQGIIEDHAILWKKRSNLTSEVIPSPLAVPVSSGMSCVDAILRAHFKVTPSPLIAASQYGYYEILNLLARFNGDIFHFFHPEKVLNWMQSLSELGSTPNLIFYDLRSIPGCPQFENGEKHLCSIREQIIQKRTPENPVTIAIDVTNDKLMSKEVLRVIQHYSQAIQDKLVNIVLYRSSHKFDQLGVDKFNGGYLEVYTAHALLKETHKNLPGQLDGLDYQALCHFHRCAALEIHEYMKIHYKNAEKFYQEISSTYVDSSKSCVYPRKDRKAYYLAFDLHSPTLFSGTMRLFALKNSIAFYERDSFGFNETVTIILNDDNMRLCPGTHGPQEIKLLSKRMIDLHHELEELL